MSRNGFVRRVERFASVGSTNDVVRAWLAAGQAEVCLAVADEQLAGRGRAGRRWLAPRGAALLLSAGFRPTWLAPDRVWRLGAIVSLAMAEAAEDAAGLAAGTIRLKWPNDLVVTTPDGHRKLGGMLGETDGLGTADPQAVVGIGVNVDWAGHDVPADLAGTMTSLREVARDRRIEPDAVLDGFIDRLEGRVAALRGDRFDSVAWSGRQVTTGTLVTLQEVDGRRHVVRARGVDAGSGALVIEDPAAVRGERHVHVAEITHLHLPGSAPAAPAPVGSV